MKITRYFTMCGAIAVVAAGLASAFLLAGTWMVSTLAIPPHGSSSFLLQTPFWLAAIAYLAVGILFISDATRELFS